MAQKYTQAQRDAYAAGLAAAGKSGGGKKTYAKKSSAKSGSGEKNSGCTVQKNYLTKGAKPRTLAVLVTGWLKVGTRFLKYVASPAPKEYQKNPEILKLSVKVTEGLQDKLYWGTWNPKDNMVYIQDINICGMPKKNSSFFRKDP
jgi:hypothetical protein